MRSCSNEVRAKFVVDAVESALDVSGIIAENALAIKDILQFRFEMDDGMHWFRRG